MSHKNKSLLTRILIPLNLSFVILFSALGIVGVPLYTDYARKSLDSKITAILNFAATASASAIENFDYPQLDNYIKSTLEDEDCVSMTFLDSKGEIRKSTETKQAKQTAELSKNIKVKEASSEYKVKLVYSLDNIEASIQSAVNLIVMVVIFLLFTLSTIVFVTIRKEVKILEDFSLKLDNSGQLIQAAFDKLSTTNNEISKGSSETVDNLNSTLSTVEQLSSIVRSNTENSKEAATISHEGAAYAEKGESEMKLLIAAMSDIASSSKKIEEIINVIDDISFQTNLLALNAAVEAARAGEQGKGFAVVADAVRSLASRSTEAAKGVAQLIGESISTIAKGNKIVKENEQVLNGMVTIVKKINILNENISNASAEQLVGITQISERISKLDTVAVENAQAAQDAQETSNILQKEAADLKGLSSEITYFIKGA